MQVTFAHGLLGDKSFPYESGTFTKGTLNAVRESAQESDADFRSPLYQPETDKFPAISDMAENFHRANGGKPHHENLRADLRDDLWVGSSLGAAVMLQSYLIHTRVAQDMILFKPIYDMVWSASMLLGEKNKNDLLNEIIDEFEIPVSTTEVGGDQGVFKLKRFHLEDVDALKMIEEPERSIERLQGSFMQNDDGVHQIQNLQIVCAEADPLSPPALAEKFASIIQPVVKNIVEIVTLDGRHGTDHSRWLKENVKQKLAIGWGCRSNYC